MGACSAFLKRKNIVLSAKRYGVDALGAMAQGLFCSLLIGTILDTLGKQLGIAFLVTVGGYASAMSGSAMAVAIGYALQAPPLVLFSLATVGYAANALGSVTLSGGKGAGGPLAVLFIAVIAAELGKAVSKETKIDILVTPLVTILAGVGLSALLAPAIGTAASAVGDVVKWATVLQPFWMGILVSVVIGVALTLPISSAAICAAIGLTGLAGGAAVAGCCANMVGFAVLSFRENRWGGLVSQGLGTSMLQMGNIVRNPRIWLPAILTSAITGPLATCLFRLEMNDPASAVASGMGTCGMVGPIGVYAGWVNDVATGAKAAITSLDWVGLALICFVLPAVLCWLFGLFFRRIGWIKEGHLTLESQGPAYRRAGSTRRAPVGAALVAACGRGGAPPLRFPAEAVEKRVRQAAARLLPRRFFAVQRRSKIGRVPPAASQAHEVLRGIDRSGPPVLL